MDIQERLRNQVSNSITVVKKRPDIFQVYSPFYHEDGDMIEVYARRLDGDKILLTDCGMTLMRLSYYFTIDTTAKESTLLEILNENRVAFDSITGEISLPTTVDQVAIAFYQISQAIMKASNLKILKRETIRKLFYELLDEFVSTNLVKYKYQKKYYPIPENREYEVDYFIPDPKKPIFLFGIKDSDKARLSVISCQHFLLKEIPFKSVAVYEDLGRIPKNDQKRALSAIDKTFYDLDEFKGNCVGYLSRELSC